MSILSYKRLTIALSILCFGLGVLCGCLFFAHGLLRFRVALANGHTKIFEDVRAKALRTTAEEAAVCLDYLVNYHPSGSQQQKGSQLDQMVERERMRAEQDIIAYLRSKTGQDLGASPEPWVQKYAPR